MQNSQNNGSPKPNFERVLYTILYLILVRFISMVLFVITITQFIYSWIGGEPNAQLLRFTNNLSEYTKELVLYTSFNSDEKPWPSGEWPTV
ncbi:MAG: DUF4389 domain-containing protein [Sulfurovum sp.]|jgi:hypothetical protein|nr:DUF4389 domain-containing protein [Sulfurovum sp.]